MSLGERSQEIVSIPTGSFMFGSTTGFGALLSAQEVGSQAAQDGEVELRMAVTDATVVPIQDPVDCVLVAPMAEGESQEQFSIGGKDGIQIRCRLTRMVVGRELMSVYVFSELQLL